NFEFLWYLGVLVILFALILWTLPKSRFDSFILSGLSLWGFLHLAGGALQIHGEVLYDWVLLPLVSNGEIVLLKYDQVLHFYGFALTTYIGYHLLQSQLLPAASRKTVGFILFGFGMGMGALNEVVEFIAVLTAPETGVGGYINTALDLTFNMLGVLFALACIFMLRKKDTVLFGSGS
nr:DUF2238 domain-containing protein [Candidatus Omnitrophota bacterium]